MPSDKTGHQRHLPMALLFLSLLTVTMPIQLKFYSRASNIEQNIKQSTSKLTRFFTKDNKSDLTANNLKATNTQFLIGQIYKGTFHSLQSQNLFSYLDVSEGDIQLLFYNDPLKTSSTDLNSLQIFLFNPKYHDLKAVGILIDLQEMRTENQWSEVNTKIKVDKFWKGRTEGDQETKENVTYTIQVENIKSEDPSQTKIKIDINGPGFSFTSTLDYEHDFWSTLGYCFYVTGIVCLQIFCAITILKQVDHENPAIVSKMSLLTLSICNIQDFYFTMVHIEYIMSSGTAYLLFVLPAMSYLILFVIFDMKMLFLVWRSHHLRQIDNAQALRKKLTAFYIQFYLGLFIYLTLNYFFQYEYWLIFIQHLLIIPQIVHNVRQGNNPGFSVYYILGFLGLRYMIPLYERGCPGNHFTLEPMPVLISLLGALYIIQILILFLQSKYGPRFFIPRFLLPNYYNYNVKLKLSQENKQIDCTICLLNIFSPDPIIPSQEMNINESMAPMSQVLLKQINIMKTPCNHYFHKECLTKWIDVKLECPTCRKPLPAI